jgi:membrane protein
VAESAPQPAPVESVSGRRALGAAARFLRGMWHSFLGESVTLRAGNLTFISITSLVPLIGVAVALLNAFGAQVLEKRLRVFVNALLAPGVQSQSEAFFNQFFSVAGSRTVGGLSFVIILVSAGILLRHLDAALNEVWAVRRKRPIYVSLALYLGLLLGGPALLALLLTGTTVLKKLFLEAHLPFSAQAVQLGALVSAVGALTLLYKLAPHAPVRWRSALSGGAAAGLGWELARHTYGGIASLALQANTVYGSLGIAPLFLMWIYLSWCIVLFGARLAYAVEHADFRGEFMDHSAHPRTRELLAARVAAQTALAVVSKAAGPTARELALRFNVPGQLVRDIVGQLAAAGLVKLDARGHITPSRNPEELTLADVSDAVGGSASRQLRNQADSEYYGPFAKLFEDADQATLERLKQVTWAGLNRTLPPGSSKN